jgi:adenylate cyclase
MSEKPKLKPVLHIVEILYSLVVFAWLLVPVFVKEAGLMPAPYAPFRAFGGAARSALATGLWAAAVFLPALIALFRLASPFLETVLPAFADPTRAISAMINVLGSGLVIAANVAFVFEYAKVGTFFTSSFPPASYAILGASVIYNAFFIYRFLTSLTSRSEYYKEYLRYRYSAANRQSVLEVLFKPGIQKKLVSYFLPLILVIIVVLASILMSSFSRTIINYVNDNGKLLADSTANVIRSNPTDTIAVDDYLRAAAKKNAAASIPFHDISYYRRDSKTNAFVVEASTDASLVKKRAASVEPFTETTYKDNAATKEYEFLAPVYLSKTFLGYVQVDYARDIIFEPYFRAQVKAVGFAAIFTYLSVFLIIFIGRQIVFPILFLRMSVKAISTSLESMIKGEKRISADLLQFEDRVPTRDEIKDLSGEVGTMTAVIRGIVPYISASTLKHSEREKPMTESRDLCFLFTDIRGFTSLCEGMSPEKVVEMLNYYLDIQNSVILANHGDVDKFVGDEVMAMFEGPDKELNAVKTSLEIRKAMAEEKEKAIAAKKNVVSIGIGINSGPVVFGSVGAKDRMDFTSIGDTVNLAARLEGANKAYGTKTLVTDAVYDKVKENYLCREVDMLTVKGKKLPVSVYEVIQAKDKASAGMYELCKYFEEGLSLYRGQKWVKAAKIFTALAAKYKDGACDTFLGRISLFQKSPPPSNWDGVFNMTVK